jgi:hypothetical protein
MLGRVPKHIIFSVVGGAVVLGGGALFFRNHSGNVLIAPAVEIAGPRSALGGSSIDNSINFSGVPVKSVAALAQSQLALFGGIATQTQIEAAEVRAVREKEIDASLNASLAQAAAQIRQAEIHKDEVVALAHAQFEQSQAQAQAQQAQAQAQQAQAQAQLELSKAQLMLAQQRTTQYAYAGSSVTILAVVVAVAFAWGKQ